MDMLKCFLVGSMSASKVDDMEEGYDVSVYWSALVLDWGFVGNVGDIERRSEFN